MVHQFSVCSCQAEAVRGMHRRLRAVGDFFHPMETKRFDDANLCWPRPSRRHGW